MKKLKTELVYKSKRDDNYWFARNYRIIKTTQPSLITYLPQKRHGLFFWKSISHPVQNIDIAKRIIAMVVINDPIYRFCIRCLTVYWRFKYKCL